MNRRRFLTGISFLWILGRLNLRQIKSDLPSFMPKSKLHIVATVDNMLRIYMQKWRLPNYTYNVLLKKTKNDTCDGWLGAPSHVRIYITVGDQAWSVSATIVHWTKLGSGVIRKRKTSSRVEACKETFAQACSVHRMHCCETSYRLATVHTQSEICTIWNGLYCIEQTNKVKLWDWP